MGWVDVKWGWVRWRAQLLVASQECRALAVTNGKELGSCSDGQPWVSFSIGSVFRHESVSTLCFLFSQVWGSSLDNDLLPATAILGLRTVIP